MSQCHYKYFITCYVDTHSYSLSYFHHLQMSAGFSLRQFFTYSILFPTVYLCIMRLFPPENCFCVGDLAILGKNGQKVQTAISCFLRGDLITQLALENTNIFTLDSVYLFLQVHHFGKLLAQLICNCHGNVICPSSKPIAGTW